MTEFKLLQINIISAENIARVSRSMHTYAYAWVNPDRKMTTRVDSKGHNNPKWNDTFIFRVRSDFLHLDVGNINIQIFAKCCFRDMLIGYVKVPAQNVIPANPKGTSRRSVALQVRRPSGRPQGILNIAVALVDATMKSMPLSGIDDSQTRPNRSEKGRAIRRVKSERSWSAVDEEAIQTTAQTRSAIGPGSEVAPTGPVGSMCNSDVGPSASVVAAAVARGLYIPPILKGQKGGVTIKDDGESSILQWTDDNSQEGLMTQLERWRMELNSSVYDRGHRRDGRGVPRHKRSRNKREDGKFRCFGKTCCFDFEFTIACGGDNGSNQGSDRRRLHFKKKVHSKSDDGSSSHT